MRPSRSSTMIPVVAATLLVVLCSSGTEAQRRQSSPGRLLFPVKFEKVTTNTIFAIETSTTFPYCVLGVYNTNLCLRRRRRKRSGLDEVRNIEDAVVEGRGLVRGELEGTMQEEGKIALPRTRALPPKGKIMTVMKWNTVSVTESVTVAFTDPATTISLSLVCIPPGGDIPPQC